MLGMASDCDAVRSAATCSASWRLVAQLSGLEQQHNIAHAHVLLNCIMCFLSPSSTKRRYVNGICRCIYDTLVPCLQIRRLDVQPPCRDAQLMPPPPPPRPGKSATVPPAEAHDGASNLRPPPPPPRKAPPPDAAAAFTAAGEAIHNAPFMPKPPPPPPRQQRSAMHQPPPDISNNAAAAATASVQVHGRQSSVQLSESFASSARDISAAPSDLTGVSPSGAVTDQQRIHARTDSQPPLPAPPPAPRPRPQRPLPQSASVHHQHGSLSAEASRTEEMSFSGMATAALPDVGHTAASVPRVAQGSHNPDAVVRQDWPRPGVLSGAPETHKHLASTQHSEAANGAADSGQAAATAAEGTGGSTQAASRKLPAALLARLRKRGIVHAAESATGRQDAATTGAADAAAQHENTELHASAPVPGAAVPQPVLGHAVDLPPGWSEAVDPTYSHPYWFNASTGERTWVKPTLQPPPEPEQAQLVSGPLLPGWRQAVDPTTNITYYYNRALNKQQWTRPGSDSGRGHGGDAGTAEAGGQPPDFRPSSVFTGGIPGYAFKKGPQGQGYYRRAFTEVHVSVLSLLPFNNQLLKWDIRSMERTRCARAPQWHCAVVLRVCEAERFCQHPQCRSVCAMQGPAFCVGNLSAQRCQQQRRQCTANRAVQCASMARRDCQLAHLVCAAQAPALDTSRGAGLTSPQAGECSEHRCRSSGPFIIQHCTQVRVDILTTSIVASGSHLLHA